jgi:DNA-binding NarL/FixJ family response regulator
VADFAGSLKTTQRQVLECLMLGLTWREAGDRLGFTSANVAYHVRQIQNQYRIWDGELV